MVDQIEAQDSPQDSPQGQLQQRVARNAGIYLVVQIISWVVTFVGLGIVPRYLGAQAYGELILAGSTGGLVFGVGSFCIDNFLVREVGRDPSQAEPLVRATLGLRLAMLAILCPATYLVTWSLHASPIVMLYSLMYLSSWCVSSLSEPLRSVLAGREQAFQVSLSDLFVSAYPLLAIPFLAYGPKTLIYAIAIAHVLVLLLRRQWLRNVVTLRPSFDPRLWLRLIRGGVPFMLNNYVGMLYGYMTILVLNHFLHESAVGEYNQANKLIGTFLVVPTVLSAALLPVLTRMADMDPKAFAQAKVRVLSVLIVTCLPVMVGVVLLAQPLCHLLYGASKFAHVPLALQLGALQLLPLYVVSVVYQFLVAQNRNGIWSGVLLGTVVLNTLLAWVLVPYTQRTLHNGIVGASLSGALAEFTAMWFAFRLLQVNPFVPAFVGRMLRGGVATGAMGLLMWEVREGIGHLGLPFTLSSALQLLVSAVLGAGVFLLLAGLLRAFPAQEQDLVVNALKRKFRRAA